MQRIHVCDKPVDIEEHCHHGIWQNLVKKLLELESTQCVSVDIQGAAKNRIMNIKQGIKGAAKRIGMNGRKIRFAVKTNTLYVWLN